MAMPAWMPEEWANLSEDDQRSVSDLMRLLLSKKPRQNGDSPDKPLHYGVFKGRIRMPDDFDDPLPEFSDNIIKS